jgi:hypothetical protein
MQRSFFCFFVIRDAFLGFFRVLRRRISFFMEMSQNQTYQLQLDSVGIVVIHKITNVFFQSEDLLVQNKLDETLIVESVNLPPSKKVISKIELTGEFHTKN